MNTIREVQNINEEELKRGIAGTKASWHAQYVNSAWVYVGNLDHSLVEGDAICVLSQYGEIDDFCLVRDETTGKSRGFAFCKYADARSCVLAVDNFCGIELCGRSLRVDHVENYRLPKHLLEKAQEEEDQVNVLKPGAAYQGKELASKYSLEKGHDLFAPPESDSSDHDEKQQDEDDESSVDHGSQDKEARKKRKEERRLKREERAERKRLREGKQMKREEERRKKRARRLGDHDDGDSKDRDDEDKSSDRKAKEIKKKKRKHDKRRDHERSDPDNLHSKDDESGDERERRKHSKHKKKKKSRERYDD